MISTIAVKEMRSNDSINGAIGLILAATNRLDELGKKKADYIMDSDSCEFVKRMKLAQNKKEITELKRLIYLK